MVKRISRLSARTVATLSKPGLHADGGNLYLRIDGGAKSWVFRYKRKKQHDLGLGSVNSVSLAKAREVAASYRAMLAEGRQPVEERQAERAESRGRTTFGAVAERFVAANAPAWRSEKHRRQWQMTLTVYGKPLIAMPVDAIDTAAVLAVLQPLWQSPHRASAGESKRCSTRRASPDIRRRTG